MSGKHTPGPWVKDRHGQLRSPQGKQVGVWDAGIAWVQRDEESEANARLIAAAPDLLEALKQAVDREEYGKEEGDEVPQWLLDARAAIAKAEGRT